MLNSPIKGKINNKQIYQTAAKQYFVIPVNIEAIPQHFELLLEMQRSNNPLIVSLAEVTEATLRQMLQSSLRVTCIADLWEASSREREVCISLGATRVADIVM